MNLLRNKFRPSVQEEYLRDLLMIRMNGPALDQFQNSKACAWPQETK
jgi:hypothetical protein